MKAMVLEALGLDNLRLKEIADPTAGYGEVLVRLHAASLNFRDLIAATGGYGSRQQHSDLILLSDGAGEIVEVGAGVQGWRIGDRVAGCFFPHWQSGPPRSETMRAVLGGSVPGVASELRSFAADTILRIPDYLDYAEAATLPCAGLTAWNAVRGCGAIGPEHIVLTQGTGGVSLFALQFAILAGAGVIATSSSEAKLDRLRGLGAAHVLNYVQDPSWGKSARHFATDGVDLVVDIGGASTLDQSMRAVKTGGTIAMVGVVGGDKQQLNIGIVAMSSLRLNGVTVGSRAAFVDMLVAMSRHKMRPVIDKVFPLAELPHGDVSDAVVVGD
jgi:alcohol dehydrogenase